MNAAILQKVEPTRAEPTRGYATFVSPRSNRIVACLFVRDVDAWRALIGGTFDVTATFNATAPDPEFR